MVKLRIRFRSHGQPVHPPSVQVLRAGPALGCDTLAWRHGVMLGSRANSGSPAGSESISLARRLGGADFSIAWARVQVLLLAALGAAAERVALLPAASWARWASFLAGSSGLWERGSSSHGWEAFCWVSSSVRSDGFYLSLRLCLRVKLLTLPLS